MKKGLSIVFFLLGALVFIASCGNQNTSSSSAHSSSEGETKVVPIYEGVSFSSQATYESRMVKRKNQTGFDESQIEESIKKEFGVLTSEELSYYTIKGEKAYITLNFHNPDQFEILGRTGDIDWATKECEFFTPPIKEKQDEYKKINRTWRVQNAYMVVDGVPKTFYDRIFIKYTNSWILSHSDDFKRGVE